MVTARLAAVIRRFVLVLGFLPLGSTPLAANFDNASHIVANPTESVPDPSKSPSSPGTNVADADGIPNDPATSVTTENEPSGIETSKDIGLAGELGPGDDSDRLATKKRKRLWERMSPLQRTRMILGLTSVLLLGGFLLFCVWLGSRAARRYIQTADRARYRPTQVDLDDWARKPLVPPIDEGKDGS